MHLLVISDTHIPGRANSLPQVILTELRQADFVIHAGDFIDQKVLELLEQAVPFAGVSGNNDGPELQQKLGNKKELTLQGYRIGVVHGDLGKERTTLDRALHAFAGEDLDLLVFGHSHVPYLNRHGRTWVMNPGSPTDRRRFERYSYGLVELGEELVPQLVYFDKTQSLK